MLADADLYGRVTFRCLANKEHSHWQHFRRCDYLVVGHLCMSACLVSNSHAVAELVVFAREEVLYRPSAEL